MTTMAPLRLHATPSIGPAEDDEILLERMRDGDAEAYRTLLERHIDRAYALALRMLRSQADAEDVTQEAFIKAWQNRESWQSGKAKFSTWLYRVIVNRCIDLHRKPPSQCLEEIPEPEDGAEDVVSAIQRRQVYGQLDVALGRLPSQQRAALVLSYCDDLSNGEISDVMGLSVSAVESLLKRGRQKLREQLRRSETDMRHVLR